MSPWENGVAVSQLFRVSDWYFSLGKQSIWWLAVVATFSLSLGAEKQMVSEAVEYFIHPLRR